MSFEFKCKGTSCKGCLHSLNKCAGKAEVSFSCALNVCPLIESFDSDEAKEEACKQCNWTSKEEKTLHKIFTKEDLQNGMVVNTRGAGKFLCIKSDFYTGKFDYLLSFEDYSVTELSIYEEDLRVKRHLIKEIELYLDITEVYIVNNLAFFSTPMRVESEKFLDKIWERNDDFNKALETIANYFEVNKASINLTVDGCEL